MSALLEMSIRERFLRYLPGLRLKGSRIRVYQVMSHANADARIITVGDIDVEPTITVISFPSAL